jgi:hypothetical protein
MFGDLLELDAGIKMAGPLGRLFDSGGKENLSFPEELQQIDHWVTFTAMETFQAIRTESSKSKAMSSITLPLPAGLQTAYNISYSETSLGALGREFMDALGTGAAATEAQKFLGGLGSAAVIGGAGGVIAGGLLGTGAIGGAISGAVAGIAADGLVKGLKGNQTGAQVALSTVMGEDKMAAAAASQFGVARNPHKVVLFDSVGFRTHSFSYQFTPKNRRESETLKKIIKLFKYHASPGMNPTKTVDLGKSGLKALEGAQLTLSGGKHFFKYPEFFQIKFHHPEFLFAIGESVLKSVDVNYHGGGSVSYARDTADATPAPTQVNLNLSFMETDIITKEKIEDGR